MKHQARMGLARDRIGDRRLLTLLIGITAAALLIAMWATRTIDPLRSDSPSYLYFDPTRTAGYPAFLAVVRLLTGNVAFAVPVQAVLLGASLLALGWSFHKFVGKPKYSIPFQLLLVSSPIMWRSSASLLTEALATACVALWCAQLLHLLRRPSQAGIISLIAIAAIGSSIRPSLIALCVATGLFLLVRIEGKRRWRMLALTVVATIAAWAVTPVAVYLVDDGARPTSPLPRGILQHSLFCAPGEVPNDADSQLVEREAAAARRYIDGAPGEIRPLLERYYSSHLRFALIIPALGREHHLAAGWQTDPIVSRIAWQRVASNPLCYVAGVIASDIRMATYQTTLTPAAAERAREYVAAHPPAPLSSLPLLRVDQRMDRQAAAQFGASVRAAQPGNDLLVPDKNPTVFVWIARLLYGSASVFGLVALSALVRRRATIPKLRQSAIGVAALGAAFHGVLGITAIVELGLARYLVPVWPMVCAIDAVALVAVLDYLSRRRSEPLIAPAIAVPVQ